MLSILVKHSIDTFRGGMFHQYWQHDLEIKLLIVYPLIIVHLSSTTVHYEDKDYAANDGENIDDVDEYEKRIE